MVRWKISFSYETFNEAMTLRCIQRAETLRFIDMLANE